MIHRLLKHRPFGNQIYDSLRASHLSSFIAHNPYMGIGFGNGPAKGAGWFGAAALAGFCFSNGVSSANQQKKLDSAPRVAPSADLSSTSSSPRPGPDGWKRQRSANEAPQNFEAGALIRRVPCRGMVALTIDDGPGEACAEILQVLERFQAKCTFFAVGNRLKGPNEDLARRLSKNGNEIGNHSEDHPIYDKLSGEAQRRDMLSAQREIRRVTGRHCWYFRPPGGHWNEQTLQAAKQLHCAVVTWSVDTRDWSPETSDREVLSKCMNAKEGDIILLHDRHRTARLLPKIIQALRSRGLEPVTVSDMLNAKQAENAGTNRIGEDGYKPNRLVP